MSLIHKREICLSFLLQLEGLGLPVRAKRRKGCFSALPINLGLRRSVLSYRSEAVGADRAVAKALLAEPGYRLPIVSDRHFTRKATVVRVRKIVVAYLHRSGLVARVDRRDRR